MTTDSNRSRFRNSRPLIPCAAVIALASIIATAGPGGSGELNPPSGPVGSTPDSSGRVAITPTTTPGDANNHFIISQDGHYVLRQNVNITDGRTAILVTASRAIIDLGGNVLNGAASQGMNGDGIVVNVTMPGGATVTIKNGTIAGFANGINVVAMPDNLASHFIVEDDTRVINNDVNGALVNHRSSRFFNSDFSGNKADGINAPLGGARVSGGSASGNGDDGVDLGNGSRVEGVDLKSNVANGAKLGDDGTVSGGAISGNGADGVNGGDDLNVRDAKITDNAGDGVEGSGEASVGDCRIHRNMGTGVKKQTGVVSGGSVRGNGNGVQSTGASRIKGTRILQNTTIGLNVGPCSIVEETHVLNNGGDGAVIGNCSSLKDSVVSGNGGKGAVLGDDTHLENTVVCGNGDTGVEMGDISQVSYSTIGNNMGDGFVGGEFVRICHSNVHGNAFINVTLGQFGHIMDTFTSNAPLGMQLLGGTRVDRSWAANHFSEGVGLDGPGVISDGVFVNNGSTGVLLGFNADGAMIKGSVMKFHPFGAGLRIFGDHCVVFDNGFLDNMQDINDGGVDSCIAPIDCDPATHEGGVTNLRLN